MASNKLKTPEIYRKDWALNATNTVKVDIDPSVMPSGLIRGFWVKLQSAAITGFSSATTDYPKILRNITYGASFPKHNVMTALEGKFWDNVWTQLNRFAAPRTTPNASGFDILYYLPFAWPGTDKYKAYRPKDTALLNINNKALPFISLNLGVLTDLATGATACNVTVVVEADYDPIVRPGMENPVNPVLSGDQPGRYLEFLSDQKADLATTCMKTFVTGGPRECIGVVARELDNTGAEVSNIFTYGVATPSKFVFQKGDSDAYNPDEKVNLLDGISQQRFGIAPIAGYHYWFAARTGKLRDCVDLRDGGTFKLSMDNLATTSNRVLQTLQINTVDIPADVLAVHSAQLGVAPGA